MNNHKIPTIVIPTLSLSSDMSSINSTIETSLVKPDVELDLGEITKPTLRRYPQGLSPPPLRRHTATMYTTFPEPILRRQKSKEILFDYSENVTNDKNTLEK